MERCREDPRSSYKLPGELLEVDRLSSETRGLLLVHNRELASLPASIDLLNTYGMSSESMGMGVWNHTRTKGLQSAILGSKVTSPACTDQEVQGGAQRCMRVLEQPQRNDITMRLHQTATRSSSTAEPPSSRDTTCLAIWGICDEVGGAEERRGYV